MVTSGFVCEKDHSMEFSKMDWSGRDGCRETGGSFGR